ncbi:MAG: NTP transferase domain-containing protein [Planctomycetes bacterium]|nr:NTP transferase domain-containing protein [Planctomycetota bacterium]
MSLAEGMGAVILAGDRGADDPVARARGTRCKALTPINGRPMLMRVLDALDDRGDFDRIVICGPRHEIASTDHDLQKRLGADPRLHWIDQGPSPASSAAAALDEISAEEPCFLTTADHALLDPDLLASFLDRALERREDVVVGLARLADVHAAYPQSRRTSFKLRDAAYCGCNLFLLRNARARRAAAFWRRVEDLRKKPWRVAGVFGPRALLGLITHSLSLPRALELMGRKMGLSIGAVVVDHPELAVDVDSADDFLLAEQILVRREGGAR